MHCLYQQIFSIELLFCCKKKVLFVLFLRIISFPLLSVPRLSLTISSSWILTGSEFLLSFFKYVVDFFHHFLNLLYKHQQLVSFLHCVWRKLWSIKPPTAVTRFIFYCNYHYCLRLKYEGASPL